MGDHGGMPETPHQAKPQDSPALLDRRLAYLLLRLTLGINILLHGTVRLPALGALPHSAARSSGDHRLPRRHRRDPPDVWARVRPHRTPAGLDGRAGALH